MIPAYVKSIAVDMGNHAFFHATSLQTFKFSCLRCGSGSSILGGSPHLGSS